MLSGFGSGVVEDMPNGFGRTLRQGGAKLRGAWRLVWPARLIQFCHIED